MRTAPSKLGVPMALVDSKQVNPRPCRLSKGPHEQANLTGFGVTHSHIAAGGDSLFG
jgi:hypothetical protein